ncbi:hypothetical protein ABW20_dc0105447 [Dactylellina cionopaga]|nr:hypothetical protein ABW20_dc0105447 [Dactylellina cionopaga]
MTTDTLIPTLPAPEPHQAEIGSLILDTGPIIKNICSPQSLLAKSGTLITLPSVVSEIRDAATRSRFETLWSPFLQYRSPKPDSIKYVSNFARKTGDYGVLGPTDLQVLALTYEVECEKLGGIEEFQRRLKEKEEEKTKDRSGKKGRRRGRGKGAGTDQARGSNGDEQDGEDGWTTVPVSRGRRNMAAQTAPAEETILVDGTLLSQEASATTSLGTLSLNDQSPPDQIVEDEPEITTDSEEDWITTDNLAANLSSDGTTSIPAKAATQITTACCTTDFAMQNVLLQLHIHLFSPTTMSQITSVKSHVLRCHACFKIVRDIAKQFCPSCGQPSLTKVTCSTDSHGIFRVHLKKNWQWNNRGNVFSIAKAQHGTASMKGVKENIVLSEDQKEYEKAWKESKRIKERDLMDRDYLPGLLTGERLGHGGNPKVGAGRSVNASRRTKK